MPARYRTLIALLGLCALVLPRFVSAQSNDTLPFFSTGGPDGRLAAATRPGTGPGTPVGLQETEAGDDFILGSQTSIGGATFTGLLPSGAPLSSIQSVIVEIYRVFPKDSDAVRTPRVPTRANSPSDVEFDDRRSATGTLQFSAQIISPSFTAANSVDTGIHPLPNQTTGGEGAVTGEEVQFTVAFTPPFSLPADHYFFVPQVGLNSGHFRWLSAPGPGGPPDLQAWIRNSDLDPDWLRIGTDIIGGAAKFNLSFSLFNSISLPATGTGAQSQPSNAPGAFILPPLATLLPPTTSVPPSTSPATTPATTPYAPPTNNTPPPSNGVCPGGAPVALGQMCPGSATAGGTAPSAPNEPQANVLSASQVRFDWSAVNATPPVTTYYLYTWNGSSVGPLVTVDAPTTTYTVSGLAPGSYVCVTVSAKNAAGNSPWSNWSCATSSGS